VNFGRALSQRYLPEKQVVCAVSPNANYALWRTADRLSRHWLRWLAAMEKGRFLPIVPPRQCRS